MLDELLPEDINLGVVRERRRREVMNDAFAGCDEDLTIEELYESVRKLKNHKPGGPDSYLDTRGDCKINLWPSKRGTAEQS